MQLTKSPLAILYNEGSLKSLQQSLSVLDTATVRVTITKPEDLELDAQGHLVRSGYTLSPLACQQLCKLAARGLWPLVADIGGVVRSHTTTSVPLAAQIINQCVKLRFRSEDGLDGKDMIQNAQNKTVDGIVGPKYRYLSNSSLLTNVLDILRDHPNKVEYSAGMLTGRRMSLWFLSTQPVAMTNEGEPIYHGCYFTNSEAGECGVHTAGILKIHGRDGFCTTALRHIVHAGKDFDKRVMQLLATALHRMNDLTPIASKAGDVMATSLNVVSNGKLDDRRRQALVRRLERHVDTTIAQDVVRKAIFMGADGKIVPARVSSAELSTRTVRDLVLTAMKVGATQYQTIREGLERAAFDILENNV